MIQNNSSVRVGMNAVSTKGERLGKIIQCGTESFIVEKGLFFPKDYQLRHEYVSDIRNDEVIYALEDNWATREGGVEARTETTAARSKLGAAGAAVRSAPAAAAAAVGGGVAKLGSELKPGAQAEARLGTRAPLDTKAAAPLARAAEEDIRIQLLDEQLSVEKVTRETGHVRIHKAVKTEQRHVTVPVMREEIVIERSVGREDGVAAAIAPFEDQVVDLAVYEEEVRVTKRPVVREEVHIRKVVHQEQRDATATLRHEECSIEDTTAPVGTRPAVGRIDEPVGYGAPGRSPGTPGNRR